MCYSGPMSEAIERFLMRATAHARPDTTLAVGQRWRNGVTDEAVGAVFYAMEAEAARFARDAQGRWSVAGRVIPLGHSNILKGVDLSTTIREMIRTGLLRCWTSRGLAHLTPARVHLRDRECRCMAACRTPVEGMKEGRVRTVDDLALVDCLECEDVVAKGVPRTL